jgi:hypothetical protein
LVGTIRPASSVGRVRSQEKASPRSFRLVDMSSVETKALTARRPQAPAVGQIRPASRRCDRSADRNAEHRVGSYSSRGFLRALASTVQCGCLAGDSVIDHRRADTSPKRERATGFASFALRACVRAVPPAFEPRQATSKLRQLVLVRDAPRTGRANRRGRREIGEQPDRD